MKVIKHLDPIGHGLASEAFVEPAGPDCIIPGLTRPVRVLGVQVWSINLPVNASMKALEPVGREMRSFNKLLDKAFDLMQAPFGDQ